MLLPRTLHLCWTLLALVLTCSPLLVSCQNTLSLVTPQLCAQQGLYLDTLALTCRQCSQGARVLPSGLGCECNPGLGSAYSGEGVAVVCANCTSTPRLCEARAADSTYVMPSAGTNVFFRSSNIVVKSRILADLLQQSFSYCLPSDRQNSSACNTLGNLCVLTLYDATSEPCRKYADVNRERLRRPDTSFPDWPVDLPWLYYDNGLEPILAEDVKLHASFLSSSPFSTLRFVLVSYSLTGQLLAVSDLTTQIQLCTASQQEMAAWRRFGTGYNIQCDLMLRDVMSAPVFYDAYLVDESSTLYPVPVKVLQLRNTAGKEVNSPSASPAETQFVRRFFMIDNSTGVSTSGTLDAIRIAKHIKVVMKLRNKKGNIYPPYIEIEYTDVRVPQPKEIVERVFFKATYESSLSSYKRGIVISMIVCAVFSVFIFFMRISSWRARNGNLYVDGHTIIVSLAYLLGIYSTFLFWILLGSTVYWLIFYRGQSDVYLLLPTAEQDDMIPLLVVMATVFKLIEVLYIIHHQSNIDVFFIDWERPRSMGIGPSSLTSAASSSSSSTDPVSIWRTYFVANEWNELQTTRRIDLSFQLLVVLAFLLASDAGDLASSDPKKIEGYRGNDDRILRFAISAILLVCVGLAQWLFRVFIYERFISDSIGDFLDLCSISNISVFVLEDDFHGYYLHGRSPHGYADTDMREMKLQLLKEEEDLTGRRGLEPNSDKQTFEIFVPHKLREQWNMVLLHLLRDEMNSGAGMRGGGAPGNDANGKKKNNNRLSDKSLHAYATINRFLAAFIQHSFRDLDYTVEDKRFLRAVCGGTPPVFTKGVFYNDDGRSYSNVFIVGQEFTIFVFEVLLFCFWDLICTNYVSAAILTFLISGSLMKIREKWGKRNLAQKTLVDDRFLI